jgi:glucose/arabinose dehydrogenase
LSAFKLLECQININSLTSVIKEKYFMKRSGNKILSHQGRDKLWVLAFVMIFGSACSQQQNGQDNAGETNNEQSSNQRNSREVNVEDLVGNLDHPWGMAFLPDGRLLVTERSGSLRILDTNNELSEPLQVHRKFFQGVRVGFWM